MRFQLPDRKPTSSDRSSVSGRYLWVLIGNTVLFTALYFALNAIDFWFVFPIYATLLAGFVAVFVIYNRGFSRKGVTREMLPDDWSEEQKTAFLTDAEQRLQRSKWMLTVILPLVLALLLDFLYLMLKDFFGGGA